MSKKRRTSKETPVAAKVDDEPDHELVRVSWMEIVEQMQIRRPWQMPTSNPANVVTKLRDAQLTTRQLAERAYPDFDWQRYDQLEHEAAQAAKQKLNHRPAAPLGRDEPKPETKIDNRTEMEKVNDKAIQQTGKALIQAQETGIQSKEDMAKAVRVAYSANGNCKLTDPQIMALALLCWELGLSPNPTLGHVYGFNTGNGFSAFLGIYGKINLARRDHKFILQDARDMTEAERQQHGLKNGDVGVMVGIIDGAEVDVFNKIFSAGIPVTLDQMYHWYPGIWRVGDNVPKTWTERMVAEKRGVGTALKRLGLNSKVGKLPEIPGYRYDAEEQAYIEENPQVGAGDAAPPAPAPEQPIDAVFEDMLQSQVQAEVERESAAPVQAEPVEVAPEAAEVVTEAPAPAVSAEEAPDTKPALRDLRQLFEAGKLGTEEIKEVPKPARIVAMLQTQVKPNLSQETISDAVKALLSNSTLNHVTTEEWRGLLAVINAKPSADEVRALRATATAEATS